MIKISFLFIFTSIFFVGCSVKKPIKSTTATVIFKTPNMKFYDIGFVDYYKDHIKLQILNTGNVVLDLKIYKDKICQSTLKCIDSTEFNKQFLVSSYDGAFLYNLFSQKTIKFKDRANNIFIKVIQKDGKNRYN